MVIYLKYCIIKRFSGKLCLKGKVKLHLIIKMLFAKFIFHDFFYFKVFHKTVVCNELKNSKLSDAEIGMVW